MSTTTSSLDALSTGKQGGGGEIDVGMMKAWAAALATYMIRAFASSQAARLDSAIAQQR